MRPAGLKLRARGFSLLRLALVSVAAVALIALSGATSSAAGPTGLVAAYSFDQGAGTTLTDASGNGHDGTVSGGATWTSGHDGGALLFNGTDASVDLGALGTFYQSGFTLEGWLQKSTTKKDVGVFGSWTSGGGPMIWIDHLVGDYRLTLGASSLSDYLDSGRTPAIGQWQYVAATFDGSTARFYLDGTEVANRSVTYSVGSSNNWRIGAYGSPAGGFFDGLIDNIRIYNRALSASEVQTDMSVPVTSSLDTSPPSAPGTVTATGGIGQVGLSWGAATDNVGVARYDVYRGTSAGFTPTTANRIAQPTGNSYIDDNLATGTYYYKVTAEDAAGNLSPPSNEASGTSSADTTAPSAPSNLAASTSGGTVTLNWSASSDNVGVVRYDVYRGTSAGFTPSSANRIAQPSGTSFADAGLAPGGYYYKVAAEDAAGNISIASNEATATILDTTPPSAPSSLGAGVVGSTVSLSWSAATDNVGVVRYDVYRGTSAGFTPTSGNRIAQPSVTSYTDSGLVAGTYYYKVTAEDAAGNVSAASNEASAAIPDTTPPSPPANLTATGGTAQATLSWSASTDDVAVTKYDVYRSTTSGFTPGSANRIAQPAGTSYTDPSLAAGTYYYKVRAEDAAGNVSGSSNEAQVSVAGGSVAVSITSPTGGTVSDVQTVTAIASAGQGVAGVQFKLDGQNLGAEDTTVPFSVSWDTRGELNDSHTLTAVARDAIGNTASSAPVTATVSNAGVSPAGLQAAYGFDDGPLAVTALDSSGNYRTATVAGASWSSAGRYGGAFSFSGTSSEVDPPPLGTFYKTGFTLEAWVYRQTSKLDTGIVGTWTSQGGPMIWIDHISGDYRLTLGGSLSTYLDSGQQAAIGRWQHVAATYDGTTARIYLDGTLAASSTFTGNVGDSNSWRIGAYGSPAGGFFQGSIDNVRIYSRALGASEIQTDLASRIQPDRIPPTVTSFTPADGATGVNAGGSVSAKFSEPMQSGSVSISTFKLKDPAGNAVPATVSYNSTTNTATLSPQVALQYGVVYRAVLQAGGAMDLAGNALAADAETSFTVEASAPTILVVTSSSNPFAMYLTEILRAEGLDDFTTLDVSLLSTSVLSNFDVVLLGDIGLTSSQVTTLTNWVNGGGKLIAMNPDKKLAALLGLSDNGTTLSNAYLKVNTSTGPGAGITDEAIQYHGSADRYSLNGATAVATLYSSSSTATSNPAVTLRSVGSSGGQAAAFTYDLARSVVYSRQGNPAWAGQDRDGVAGIRPDDMFYSSWLNTNKIAIPQADEQQRLLVNLITQMERSKLPLPHFWYLPRGLKAAIAMSGDDHSPTMTPGGTASIFDRFKQLSPAGCIVANWECIRSTSYVFPNSTLTNAQAAAYTADGFEIGLHPLFEPCPTTSMSFSAVSSVFDTQSAQFRANFTSIPAPTTSRTHCVYWPDFASEPKIELAHGVRLDGNYYHYPAAWIGSKPGFLNGGGFPMRFADTDGSLIDVYQENTNMNDEAGQTYPSTVNTLLDNALGPLGYYGVFGTNIHNDFPAPNSNDEAIVASAQARGVPIISYKQLLTWTDGRNNSTIRGLSWNAGTFTFTTTVAPGANGLQTMLPVQGPAGTLTSITRDGAPVSYTVQTIKGIQYAMFDAATATFQATYS
jgi:fibronectin type 3 domain-containing protein